MAEHLSHEHDEACALAHGVGDVDRDWRLVVLSASPVGLYLLHWGRELGYRTVLVEPDPDRVTDEHRSHADRVVTTVTDLELDERADVVATDHDTPHLIDLLAAALDASPRWVGLMGSKKHAPPHVEPLRERGYDEERIGSIHRPIGLDTGSKTPPEIALATLAGLIADRNDRAAGFADTR